jgi:hypothetical protein
MQELFDVDGARVVTAHPLAYMHQGETVTVAELEDRARSCGEIVVGYVDHELDGIAVSDLSTKVKYEDISKLIVLANE